MDDALWAVIRLRAEEFGMTASYFMRGLLTIEVNKIVDERPDYDVRGMTQAERDAILRRVQTKPERRF